MNKIAKISAPKAIKTIYAGIRRHTDVEQEQALEMATRMVAVFNHTARNALKSGVKRTGNKRIRQIDASEYSLSRPCKPISEVAIDQAFADGGWAVMADEYDVIASSYQDGTEIHYGFH
mgnify:CR=1 FL=1|jgi:hypothetical protein